jgi:hypothetical protein
MGLAQEPNCASKKNEVLSLTPSFFRELIFFVVPPPRRSCCAPPPPRTLPPAASLVRYPPTRRPHPPTTILSSSRPRHPRPRLHPRSRTPRRRRRSRLRQPCPRPASRGGTLALALLCNKALIPITVALTPPIARLLTRRGRAPQGRRRTGADVGEEVGELGGIWMFGEDEPEVLPAASVRRGTASSGGGGSCWRGGGGGW